jgi:murein DD-endopeptidase MepM/ murein hydrolase activator NlpD
MRGFDAYSGKTAVAALALLALAACTQTVTRNPVPVTQLGLNVDSRFGAVMVRGGDTLSEVAERYRLNIRDIIDLNGLVPPYHLRQDQRLLLPPPAEHKVGRNDTLLRLSRMYDVSISEMVRLNGLNEPYRLQAGQVLKLPSRLSRPEDRAQERREEIVSRVAEASQAASPQPVSAKTGEPRSLTKAVTGKGPETAAAKPALPKWREMSLAPLNGVRGDFTWPVRGKVISKYGPKPGGLFNDGINISAAKGTPVTAAAAGTVVYVGSDLRSYGNMVLVRHPGGFVTAYSHLGESVVTRGGAVAKGQKIGTVGSTGTVGEPQLHFEIRKGSQTYDPARFLGG